MCATVQNLLKEGLERERKDKVRREVDKAGSSELASVPFRGNGKVLLPWISPDQPNYILEFLAIFI